MNPVIKIENLSKRYLIGHQLSEPYATLRETFVQKSKHLTHKLMHPKKSSFEEGKKEVIWALKNISLEVKKGEKVAIIGRNGAGKTTLLKILSRITEPTNGRVSLRGRVASLLEVGTGFHNELTGRENIFLNGAILGMSNRDIKKKFDEIIAFSEVEKFLDTPMKRYSSGMSVRLAFAIAAHLEPEILLVDEVLAVGDYQFQKKCLGKMGDIASEGRTILFVSHNMAAVKNLCDRAVHIQEGEIIQTGEVDPVISQYLKTAVSTSLEQSWAETEAPGNEIVKLKRVKIVPVDVSQRESINVTTPLNFEFEYWNYKPGVRLMLYFLLFNLEGTCVFASTTSDEPHWDGKEFPKGLFRSICHVPGNLLNDGTYRVKLVFAKDISDRFFRLENTLTFDVHDIERKESWIEKWPGAVRPKLKWETQNIKNGPQK